MAPIRGSVSKVTIDGKEITLGPVDLHISATREEAEARSARMRPILPEIKGEFSIPKSEAEKLCDYVSEWEPVDPYDDSQEAYVLYWKHCHPRPFRHKANRAAANKRLRAIAKKGWKPSRAIVDMLRMVEYLRIPKQIMEDIALVIPAIAKPEDF